MRLFLLALAILIPTASHAQIVDDSAIDDLTNGNVRFEEGKFVAYLADTVSPAFVSQAFENLGLQLQDINIARVSILIVNWPSDSTLSSLETDPSINAVVPIRTGDLRMMLTDSLENAGVPPDQIAEAAADFLKNIPVGTYLVEFDYSIDTIRAADILSQFDDLAFNFTPWPPKTVTILAEPGSEPEMMERVEQLPFVLYTAMIGTIGKD